MILFFRGLFLGLDYFQAVAAAACHGVVVVLRVAAELGLHGHSGLVALELSVFLNLHVAVEILDEEVLGEVLILACGVLRRGYGVVGEELDGVVAVGGE